MVDANDKERMAEASALFKDALTHDDLHECPILIYANKQDLIQDAWDPVKFAEDLDLKKLPKDRKWYI